MGGNENFFWILDMGYRIWDTGYGLWIRSKEPKIILNQTLRQLFIQLNALISCKVRAISKSDKHHIRLDMYLGQIGYRILDMVPSSVNRALWTPLIVALWINPSYIPSLHKAIVIRTSGVLNIFSVCLHVCRIIILVSQFA